MSEPPATLKGSKSRKALVILFCGLLFLVAAVAVHTLAFKSHRTVILPKLASNGSAFGQFPPYTEAERELEKMLHGEDRDIDLALANWLIAADIPQFAGMTRQGYFTRLNVIVDVVRKDMESRCKVAISRGKDPNDPDVRCSIFCGSIIKLGFGYAEEFAQHDLTSQQLYALHGNANYVLLAGMLACQRGTCVSMPMIYIVLGQRFGFPVHLVAIGKHFFMRWEERGFRENIETTMIDHVYTTDDDFYIEDEGMTRDQLRGSDLRNLSNREVVGTLFQTRSAYWAMSANRSPSRSWVDLSRAFLLAPDDTNITRSHEAIFNRYHITRQDNLLTLQLKERDLTAPEVIAAAEASPPQATFNFPLPQPPPFARPQPFSPPTALRTTPQTVQQIQQLQIQQMLGTPR